MSKIIKAQAGVAVRAIPTIAPALPVIGSVVSKVLPVIGGVPGVIASTLFEIATGGKSARPGASQRNSKSSVAVADATRVARPVVVPTPSRQVDLHSYATRTISRPMAVIRTMSAAADSTGTAAPRDTTGTAAPRDTTGTATPRDTTGTATPRDTTGTATPQADDRNVLQKAGDWLARRKAKNKKPKTENPPTNPPQENKGLVKRGFGYIKEHPLKSTLIGGPAVFLIGPKPFVGAWDVTSGIIKNRAKAWSFEEEDKNKTHNIGADKSAKSVQNDTTQAYNGFLINQQNLVE